MHVRPYNLSSWLVALGSSVYACVAVAGGTGDSTPTVDEAATAKALESLTPVPLEQRVPVTIYEFHSGAQSVSVTAATDIFTTALVKSAQFRVVERQRLNQGVIYEKQLNAAGQTTGNVAQKQLRGARYIFEGTVSEANASEDQHQGGISVGGMNLGGGTNKDTIAVDVRILDAESGDVLDSVTVRRALKGSTTSVSGAASLLSTIASMHGHAVNPLTPDVNYQGSHQESVDRALRACIEASVLEIVKRVNPAALGSATP
jgi:curli biogenesis system outer membrane secretion channel CsgG